MPVYDYQCKECGYRFWDRLPQFDAPDPVCPECGGETERLFPGGQHVVWNQGKPSP